MKPSLHELFCQCYQELRPGVALPELKVEFYPYANIHNTIRLREGRLYVRLSDLLEGAPSSVLEAIAHILLAKIYRKPIAPQYSRRYRRYIANRDICAKAHLVRQMRGRKQIASPRGTTYDLELIFEDLNGRFFHGLLARPRMTWSQSHSRRSLGHYDAAHNAIVVSRIFDDPRVPRYAVEYIVYHEMLHLKHPVKLRGSRRCVHGKEFQAEENLFPEVAKARSFLKFL